MVQTVNTKIQSDTERQLKKERGIERHRHRKRQAWKETGVERDRRMVRKAK